MTEKRFGKLWYLNYEHVLSQYYKKVVHTVEKWVDQRVTMSESLSFREWMGQKVTERKNQWKSDWVRSELSQSVNELKSEWVTEPVFQEWNSQKMTVCNIYNISPVKFLTTQK